MDVGLTLDLGSGLEMELVLIPAGEFLMGRLPSESKRHPDQCPQHRVQITQPFYMGKYAVTQEQYEQVIGQNPARFKGAQNPVENVTWKDAAEFCEKLSARPGREVRLPTEAEWEYACRAGTETPFHFGGTISTDQANYDGRYTYGNGKKGVYRQKTTPVGSFAPNAWGLYDMHGNVWEWCADWYGDSYYGQSPRQDPQGPTGGEQHRVARGGSWYDVPAFCRSANRFCHVPTLTHFSSGLRVAVSPRA